jgi:hypothetical protein
MLILYLVLTNRFVSLFSNNKADGTYCTITSGKEASSGRPIRKAMEVEKKPPPMVVTIQVEMAKTLEAF